MDALHPRLLVDDFPTVFAFYAAVLPKLAGAQLAAGGPDGPYASWDAGDQGLLSMCDARMMSRAAGAEVTTGGAVMLVCRVADVDDGADLCRAHGATVVSPPADRPEWGPNLRTAHLRDPQGTLIELQSY
jgi:predicted enzyme related to lactoylglutathione lyase